MINKSKKPYLLFFDTETTGLPKNMKAPVTNLDNWPRLVQLAYLVYDFDGYLIHSSNKIIIPNGFIIPNSASNIHNITTQIATQRGSDINDVFELFLIHLERAKLIVAHNMAFDEKIIGSELIRMNKVNVLESKEKVCTMLQTVELCKIKGQYGYKWPGLTELHLHLFNCKFEDEHDALADVHATAKCFWELVKIKSIYLDARDNNTISVLSSKKMSFNPIKSHHKNAFKFHRFKDLVFISIKQLVECVEYSPKLFPGDDQDRNVVFTAEETYFKVMSDEMDKKLMSAIDSTNIMNFVYTVSNEANTNILVDFYIEGEKDLLY